MTRRKQTKETSDNNNLFLLEDVLCSELPLYYIQFKNSLLELLFWCLPLIVAVVVTDVGWWLDWYAEGGNGGGGKNIGSVLKVLCIAFLFVVVFGWFILIFIIRAVPVVDDALITGVGAHIDESTKAAATVWSWL